MNDRKTRRMTLSDVRALLPRIYTGETLRLYQSALDRVEKLVPQKLSQIPAEEKAWAAIASKIVWAGKFPAKTPEASRRAFEGWNGKVATTIRRTKDLVQADQPVDAEAQVAWDLVESYVQRVENTSDEEGQLILPNMASVSLANLRSRLGHVHPARVDHTLAAEVLHTLPSDKTASYRDSLRFFDKLIAGQNRHAPLTGLLPSVPIGPLPTLRDSPLQWSRFTPEFLADVEATFSTAIRGDRPDRDRFDGRLGHDPLGNRRAARRTRKKKVGKPEIARRNYRLALSWLIRHGFESRELAYGAACLAEVLSGPVIDQATKIYIERSRTDPALKDAQGTSSVGTYLSTLTTIARAAKLDQEVIFALEDARYDNDVDDPNTASMSPTRAAFVKVVDRDPAKIRAIVTGPQVLANVARTGFASWESLGAHARSRILHLCMAAAMLAMQLVRPLRTLNVHEMTIEGDAAELIAPAQDGAAPWLDIAKTRTKNRRAVENPVPPWAWEVVSLWIEVGRPLWMAHHAPNASGDEQRDVPERVEPDESIYLFPGARREDFVSRGVINKVWNRAMTLLGLPGLTPHVMRHVCATIYLAKRPGDYATVAALLADKLSTVEKFYVRGEGRQAAELFAEVVQELNPLLKLDVPLPASRRRA